MAAVGISFLIAAVAGSFLRFGLGTNILVTLGVVLIIWSAGTLLLAFGKISIFYFSIGRGLPRNARGGTDAVAAKDRSRHGPDAPTLGRG
jgi:hypothetical protein